MKCERCFKTFKFALILEYHREKCVPNKNTQFCSRKSNTVQLNSSEGGSNESQIKIKEETDEKDNLTLEETCNSILNIIGNHENSNALVDSMHVDNVEEI